HLAEKILLIQPLTFGGDYQLFRAGSISYDNISNTVARKQAIVQQFAQQNVQHTCFSKAHLNGLNRRNMF
ncbi:MAG: hypothetical protein WD046_03595, partial [Paracoccaceae bacterium]